MPDTTEPAVYPIQPADGCQIGVGHHGGAGDAQCSPATIQPQAARITTLSHETVRAIAEAVRQWREPF